MKIIKIKTKIVPKIQVITTDELRETPILIKNQQGDQWSWDTYINLALFIGSMIGLGVGVLLWFFLFEVIL